ncbi:STAS domain-containing protein [Natronoglycomyces albus]|uniref:Anti-sigma factor antagonist n=1 Tax=Natronoglycomyces albus TaxID=2811108 RepID=A0A895XNH7_9ACTN|nr:STAS domain-containing protein [Natronoglycomyces albus]
MHHESNETIVALTGEIDIHTVQRLTDTVDDALADAPARLVFDMNGVTFCDSQGLGTLVVLRRAATRSRSVLVLANLTAFLTRLLHVTGMDDQFVIRDAQPATFDEPSRHD